MGQTSRRRRTHRRIFSILQGSTLAGAVTAIVVVGTTASASAFAGIEFGGSQRPLSVGPIGNVSAPCSGQNAEVQQAIDPSGTDYVYEAWRGCQGIGFTRSTNQGASFSSPITLPGSVDAQGDPDVAVAPNGTVYVSFVVSAGPQSYPDVDASFDHGATFPQVTSLIPPDPDNFGDSPNLAVAPDNTVYITWAYGPSNSAVTLLCFRRGSCSYAGGDLNVVIQKSTDGAKTFGAMVPIAPGYPWSGADNAPIVVDSLGHLNVLYQDYPTNPTTHALSAALNYFSSSDDGGATWSTPVAVGPTAGAMSLAEWWNEPSLGIDTAGNLYAAWDTQGKATGGRRRDTGWLSYSQDHGLEWSLPVRAPTEQKNAPHIMEVTGGSPGRAYVGWLSDSSSRGYALYLRPFSIVRGWLTKPRQISRMFGNPNVWPGDTFGLSTIDVTHIMTSWGSAVGRSSAIYAAEVTVVPAS